MAQHRVVVYPSVNGQWRWRRLAGNGRIVAESGESYHNREDCTDIALVVNKEPFRLIAPDPPKSEPPVGDDG